MLVRRETPADHAAVHALHLAAFAAAAAPDDGAPAVEPALTDRLRDGPWFLPALSLVALDGSAVVGHVIATRGVVRPDGAGESATGTGALGIGALGIGPLGVAPAHQGRGIGSALMQALLGAAEASGETVACLLGSPDYYGRFGFRPAVDLGIAAPDPAWGGFFQARLLGTAAVPPGTFRYAAPFDAL